MKPFLAVLIFVASISFVAVAKPNVTECNRLMRTASEREYSARRVYLLAAPDVSLKPMQEAAEAFELFVSRCGVDRPLSYVGVLTHGRLAKIYGNLGNSTFSSRSADRAIHYGKSFYNRELTWEELEVEIVNADKKQRPAMK